MAHFLQSIILEKVSIAQKLNTIIKINLTETEKNPFKKQHTAASAIANYTRRGYINIATFQGRTLEQRI